MTRYKALIIPADLDQPVREATYNDEDHTSLTTLVFGSTETGGIVSVSSFLNHRVQLAYDDEGLFDPEPVVNLRAMILWAALAGRTLNDFHTPLVGQYVVLGVDPDSGEAADIPSQVATFFEEVVKDAS